MIKILDDSKTLDQLVNDTTNGLGQFQPIKALVTEELNGIYEAEIQVAQTDKHFNDLKVDGLVKIPTELGEQIFRIYYISLPINGIVDVKCQHISYDLTKIPVKPFEATGAVQVKNSLLTNIIGSYPFTMTTDINNTSSKFTLDIPRSFRECLGGYEGSILDVFRPEYEWDNLTVKMLARRGSDEGVRIAYGKNLTDFRQEENIENVYTSVLGYAVVDEKTYVGNIYNKVSARYPRVKIIDFSDQYENEDIPTTDELTQKAISYANSNSIETPNVNLTISFVPLYQTEEYKNIAPLERVFLGDTVHVYFEKLNVEASARVIRTVWNVNLKKYDEIELGNAKTNLNSVINQTVKQGIDNVYTDISSLDGSISGLNSDIETLSNDVTKLNTDVATAQGSIDTLNGNVSTINGNIATMGNTITTLDGQVQTLDGEVTTLSNNVSVYQTNQGYLNEQLDQMASVIINGLGLYRTVENITGGGYKVYLHNKPTLADSNIQYCFDANGFVVSTDYGHTWNSGFDASGNVVLNALSANEIRALQIYGSFIQGSEILFGDPNDKYITAKPYELNGANVGISFEGNGYVNFVSTERFKVSNTDTNADELNSLTIAKNGIWLVNNTTDKTLSSQITVYSTSSYSNAAIETNYKNTTTNRFYQNYIDMHVTTTYEDTQSQAAIQIYHGAASPSEIYLEDRHIHISATDITLSGNTKITGRFIAQNYKWGVTKLSDGWYHLVASDADRV